TKKQFSKTKIRSAEIKSYFSKIKKEFSEIKQRIDDRLSQKNVSLHKRIETNFQIIKTKSL
ncbi:MAG: hypothetical protein U0M28_03545, partial [Bacteroidales bacterium]|nr:hypothetical protein [Bacteroidales bacterium]